MIETIESNRYPSADELIAQNVASRIHAKDATLYNFSDNAEEFARNYMGWTQLATNPPYPIAEIESFAQEMEERGIKTVLLIGQGGSTQAPMTLTKYNKVDSNKVSFKTLDSVSPVRVRAILADCDPQTTLVIQSSKSGGTIEPSLVTEAVEKLLASQLSEEELGDHFIAITDPGSDLEKKAADKGWMKVFNGEPTVGGRYSALSVFGLVPAACVGINLRTLMDRARAAENACASDSVDNPAIVLASFLYDNLQRGRDKFSFLSPKRGRVLGLWIEQLVAESLGKEGQGILPNIEVDSLTLSDDPGDRTVIVYHTKTDLWDERENFHKSLEFINPAIPQLDFTVETVYDLAEHFVMWEYAIAMVGYLMKVCPFDQPDVQVAKTEVLSILADGAPDPTFVQEGIEGVAVGKVEVHVSKALEPYMFRHTLDEAINALLESIKPGDFFSINAFLPFTGEGRREAMEEVRHSLSDRYGVASCLEIGPRYLHSTGQLHKGGPNEGVFLVISAEETRDIEVEDPRAESLGELAKAQALGDFSILSERGRRCLHVHLPDNSAITLRTLAKALRKGVAKQR